MLPLRATHKVPRNDWCGGLPHPTTHYIPTQRSGNTEDSMNAITPIWVGVLIDLRTREWEMV